MSSVAGIEQFLQKIARIAERLEASSQYINQEYLIEFRNKVDNIRQHLADVTEKERVLRIGIVGDVKAGKSSFLNALIFNGDPVLPKAPTPMTAALTKIGYSATPKAKVVFYTDDEWRGIEQFSRKYDEQIDEELRRRPQAAGGSGLPVSRETVEKTLQAGIPAHIKACKELTRMAEKRNLDVYVWLGRTVEIHGGASHAAFLQELDRYVGSHGDFVPIVKYTEVYLDNDMLKGIEVIDTPGLNDPIVSRSRKTQDFLIHCDVVFLLSYVGQFLGEGDIRFLAEALPREGIRRAVLVGSKFDSGLLDYKVKKAPFKEVFRKSRNNYIVQAQQNLETLARSPNCQPVVRLLQQSLPPVFVSSLLYSAAKHIAENRPLTDEEERVVEQMKKRFSGFEDTPEFLRDLSNIEKTKREIFAELIKQKEQTIRERIADLTKSQKGHLLSMLENICIAMERSREDLKHYDYEELQQKLEHLRSKLNSVRLRVKYIFEQNAISVRRTINELEVDMAKEIDVYLGINISTRTETRHNPRRGGFLGLFKEYYTVTETIQTANVQEVIAGLRKYSTRVKEILNREFRTLFNLDDMKRQLKDAVIGAFDLSDEKFNEDDILIPLNSVLEDLTVPSLEIDEEGYEEVVLRQFPSGVVEGSTISKLMLEQEKMMKDFFENVAAKLQSLAKNIENSLLEQAGVFVDKIERQLKNNIELVQNLLENKEQSIRQYDMLIEQVQRFKTEIQQI